MFVEDLSGSFGSDLAYIKNDLPRIVAAIRNFSADSTFGLAGFCNKPITPFGGLSYGDFDFVLAGGLTNSTAKFAANLVNLRTTWGFDYPESQVTGMFYTARKPEVGWREGARHIIMMSTDITTHIGLESFMYGISRLNDADSVVEFPQFSGEMVPEMPNATGLGEDYPFFHQIRWIFQEMSIYPVFVVRSFNFDKPIFNGCMKANYQCMVDAFGFGVVTDLQSGSANLIPVIKQSLAEMSGTVRMIRQQDVDNVVQTWTPPPENPYLNVPNNTDVYFNISLNLLAPLSGGRNETTIVMRMPSHGDCTITVVTDYSCNCTDTPCLINGLPATCGNGFCDCGLCTCDPGWGGKNCDCDLTDTCPGNNCNGHGDCVECECLCRPGWTNDFCDCSTAPCPFCQHGDCVCGSCSCHAGFNGTNCDCEYAAPCPGSGMPCTGHGTCRCGQCVCDAGFSGIDCATCVASSCLNSTNIDCSLFNGDCNRCLADQVCSIKCDAVLSSCTGAVTPPKFEQTTAGKAVIPVVSVLGAAGAVALIVWLYFRIKQNREWRAYEEELERAQWEAQANPMYKERVGMKENPMFEHK